MSNPAAIVLAAGASRRLGRPKQLVELAGEPLLHRIARLALEAGCSPVIVVLGAEEERCQAALAALTPRLQIVVNPDWAQGMSTSLRAGIAALSQGPHPPPESVVILVSDQYRLTTDSLARLLSAHASQTNTATAAHYSGRLGVPAVFPHDLLTAVAALSGDEGARHLLAALAQQVTSVDLPEAAADLDTPEDLTELQ